MTVHPASRNTLFLRAHSVQNPLIPTRLHPARSSRPAVVIMPTRSKNHISQPASTCQARTRLTSPLIAPSSRTAEQLTNGPSFAQVLNIPPHQAMLEIGLTCLFHEYSAQSLQLSLLSRTKCTGACATHTST